MCQDAAQTIAQLLSIAPRAIALRRQRIADTGQRDKVREINEINGYDAILTCLDAVSMVRAAFEGDGAAFPSTQHRFGSPQHG
jgi:hypothetical protein